MPAFPWPCISIEGKITKNEKRGLKLLASNCDKDKPNMHACSKANYRFSSEYDTEFKGKNEFRDYAKAARYGSIACFASVNPALRECSQLGRIYASGGHGLEASPIKSRQSLFARLHTRKLRFIVNLR